MNGSNMKKQSKGFTLLEILLTIMLIGILATIVLVAINPNKQISQSRNLVRKADINSIYNALQQYNAVNRGVSNFNISNNYTEICDTGSLTTEDSLPSTNYCDGKIDLRALVPTYLIEIPKDTDTSLGGTGYELAKDSNNQTSLRSNKEELSQIVAINPLPTPEELIQAQIAAGTLIPTGTQQLVLDRLVYKNNAGTQTYIDKSTTTRTCPANYIPVPGNSMYGTSDFCVMKYEAKTGSATVSATTQAAGNPQVNITQPNAITACSLNGAGYGLINNNEWMTIARNIEGQGVNWTGGAVGSGGLWRGHSDGSPNNVLAASTDDNDPYFGTGNTSPSIERRTHTLSNGGVIWDLSGNVWEFTNNTILGKDQPTGTTPGFNWRQYTAITNYGTLSYDLTHPSNTSWNSSQNMGQIYSDGTSTNNTTFAFIRGGDWDGADTTAGVFTLRLHLTPASTFTSIGFRCVLR
jgi:prepilin-type N-terminal cleavage/methylation domain-containing protein